MVQAHAHELLNQKDAEEDGPVYVSEPLYRATERVAAALDRLERSLVPQHIEGERRNEQLMVFAQENDHLREERASLNAALEELQHQYDGLRETASTIYNKLNDTIKRLTQIIGD